MAYSDVATALHDFWNSFGVEAYPEETVPDNAERPYITYEIVMPEWYGMATYNVRLWTKSTAFKQVTSLAEMIRQAIGDGKRIPVRSGGNIWLFKDENFFQIMPSEDITQKNAYLSMVIHVIA